MKWEQWRVLNNQHTNDSLCHMVSPGWVWKWCYGFSSHRSETPLNTGSWQVFIIQEVFCTLWAKNSLIAALKREKQTSQQTLPVSFQENPYLQSCLGLFERWLWGGGRPWEGPQWLSPSPQHRDVPYQAARGESPRPAWGHHEGSRQFGRPPGQQRHLQRGVVEPWASLWQHRGEAERKSRHCSHSVVSSVTL